MKRPYILRFIVLCAAAFLLCLAGSVRRAPVLAQSANPTDDGLFTIYTTIDFDSSNVVSAYASDPEADPEEYDDIESWVLDGPTTWELYGDDYSDSGDGDSFSSGPVPPASSYTAYFSFDIKYVYIPEDGEECEQEGIEQGACEGWDYPEGYASTYVPLAPQITSLSTYSVYQGDQGTLTVTGSNFIEESGDQLSLNFSGPSNPFTLTSTPSTCTANCTATFSYDFTGYPVGTYTLSVSNDEDTSNVETFTVNSESTLDPCAITSNPHAGFTSIVSTGTSGGSGTMSVSFSGADFATIGQTVTYGPYSTPASIAAAIAAKITYYDFRYGLSAKAFGPNIVYSGRATLGTVSNPATGSSFTTTTSATAIADTESSCQSAPPQLPSAVISMAFTGTKNPQDNLKTAANPRDCSENLGLQNCPTFWLWNLEGTVRVTDNAANWTVNQQIVSGTTTYMYKDSSGTLQPGSYTDTPGADGPGATFLQKTAGTGIIFWIDGPGLGKTLSQSGSPIDSAISKSVYSVSVCSTINTSICATKKWFVNIFVDPGQVLDDTLSNAGPD